MREVMPGKIVVLVTCGTSRESRRIARALVEERLAACVNVITAPIHSIYRWKRRVAQASEFLLLIKTSRKRFAALRARIAVLHSYDVPEIIALPIAAGAPAYLRWLDDSLRTKTMKRKKKSE
jgi:periplasmic divalent cation tolerance protein